MKLWKWEADFELVLEQVLLVRNLAIKAKELLFLFAEGLTVMSVSNRR